MVNTIFGREGTLSRPSQFLRQGLQGSLPWHQGSPKTDRFSAQSKSPQSSTRASQKGSNHHFHRKRQEKYLLLLLF